MSGVEDLDTPVARVGDVDVALPVDRHPAGRPELPRLATFAAGLLESRLAQNVNIVNAELLARERGIDIIEQTSPKKGDFGTLIQAEVKTDKKTYTAAATLF